MTDVSTDTPAGWIDRLRTAELDELVAELGGAEHVRDLTYAQETLTVATNSGVVLKWAQRYLEPIVAFAETTAAPTYWSLITPHAAAIAGALDGLPARPRPIHLRRIGGDIELTECRRVVVDPYGPVLYVIDSATRRVLTLAPNQPNELRDLARQARELLLTGALQQGYVTVHAATVARHGEAVLIAGDKGSGKSTVCLKLLEQGADYIGNDRALLGIGPDGLPEVLPYAMSARFGGGTLQHSAALRTHLHAFDHFFAAVLPLEEQFIHQDKLELTAHELTEILGIRQCDRAPLRQIIWPRLRIAGDSALGVERLDPTETAQRLRAMALVPDPDGAGWLRELLGGVNHLTDDMDKALGAAAELPSTAIAGDGAVIAEATTRQCWPLPAPSRDPQTWTRSSVRARMVAVMHHARTERRLTLAGWNTRAVAGGDVHELLVCWRADLDREQLDNLWYLGFAAFDAGLLAVGDEIRLGHKLLAVIVGFDDTHLPNHMNIVCAAEQPRTGQEIGLTVGAVLDIVPARNTERP